MSTNCTHWESLLTSYTNPLVKLKCISPTRQLESSNRLGSREVTSEVGTYMASAPLLSRRTVMMDGSQFLWLIGRGPGCHWILTAASSLVWSRLAKHDSTEENAHTLQMLEGHGRSLALYTDKNNLSVDPLGGPAAGAVAGYANAHEVRASPTYRMNSSQTPVTQLEGIQPPLRSPEGPHVPQCLVVR